RGGPNGNGQRRKRKATSLGSGFIIETRTNGDSYVVTNNHVIQDADEITVILQDNSRLDATVVGRDVKTDLAVLKIKSKRKLPSVKFGDSDKSRVGDWIVAIGNPFGLGGTVTSGIISARGRDIRSGPYDNFLQTDASINRGNSGGPMFNMDGDVIGINSAIYSPSGGSVGIGFAIPSSGAKPIVAQLIKFGEVRRGWLGVHIQAVTEEIAETLGLDKPRGALVASLIKDGPAEKSGVKTGDVILEFNDRKVPEMRKLPRIVAETEIDKPVSLTVWRDGKEVKLKVIVGQMDESEVIAALDDEDAPGKPGGDRMVDPLGVALAEITEPLRAQFKLDKEARGVVVTEVKEDSVAAEKGIRPGDLIVEVSQGEVTTPGQVTEKIDAARKEGRKRILLLIEGQTGLRFVALKINKEK
ncbi:MAG TPA: Do family serine endopeptidase, partial [Rhodospirillales bacterium]|nr:Do family serine endopeptidase [Rhodospirillales bacterium]